MRLARSEQLSWIRSGCERVDRASNAIRSIRRGTSRGWGSTAGTVLIFERQPDESRRPLRPLPEEQHVSVRRGAAVASRGRLQAR